jgi:plasmid replication initiation protein
MPVWRLALANPKEQLDLFTALIGDFPFRDDREMMSAPMVSLSKKPPTEMSWVGPSGQMVKVMAKTGDGIATIYDFDVIIWAVSQVNAAVERGNLDPGPTITFRAYDLLKSIRRGTSGRDYERLKASIDRLRSTRVLTTIRRREKDRMEDFSLLSEAAWEEDLEGRPLGMQITLPRWIYRAVVGRREILAISPLYFDLTSGVERFLYRLARRHAGNGLDNPDGWVFSFRDLHGRTGSPAPFGQFCRDLRKIIARNSLPTYEAIEERGANGHPMLRLRFRKQQLG